VSLAAELSTRMMKESFVGKHLMLKVMRRAAGAPLDPPKHLGHGECDTFNKSIQLGVATNNPETLGHETILMMRSLRIPPGELRGVGLQMGKLERPRELKHEMGQKKLNFSKSASAETYPEPNPQDSLSVKPQSPVAPLPQIPTKATQLMAATQIDPDVLANLPEDIRESIVSWRPIQVQPREIDEDVLKELPLSIQEELQQAYKRPVTKPSPKKKKSSPRKTKSIGGLVGQTKLPIASPDDLDPSVLAQLPSTIRREVISNVRHEQALAQASKARHQAWAAEKAVRDRKINRTVAIPEPPPKPTFQRMSELPDLRNLISMWFEELRDEGPAEEDVELLGSYLRKVVLIEKDIRKAGAVVKWFLWCSREIGPAMDEWWVAGQRLGDYVNDACMERGVGKIDFDSQSQ
jgi:DNA repair protein REV1